MTHTHIHVSGHLDLTNAEFVEHYAPRLIAACKSEGRAVFHIGDARGADAMAQEFLSEWRAWVLVYHMFDKPRNHYDKRSQLVGGFTTDDERDAAMTAATTEDIAWVRPGRERSGTAKNILRRGTPTPEWCAIRMASVTRENAASTLAGMTPEQRTAFEWWFTGRFGSRIPETGHMPSKMIRIGSNCPPDDDTDNPTSIHSRFAAMHRAILASREPL